MVNEMLETWLWLIMFGQAVGVIYMVAFGCWTWWIDRSEFMPAHQEFLRAEASGDRDGMNAARRKTSDAHLKSFDPLFFIHYPKRDSTL